MQTPAKHGFRVRTRRKCDRGPFRAALPSVWGARQALRGRALQRSPLPLSSFSFRNSRPACRPGCRALCSRLPLAPGVPRSLARSRCLRLSLFQAGSSVSSAFYVDASFWEMRPCHHPSGILFFIVKNRSPEASFYVVDSREISLNSQSYKPLRIKSPQM